MCALKGAPGVRIPLSPPSFAFCEGVRYCLGAKRFGDMLSKKADLAFHAIAKLEAGSTPNPPIDTVKKITNALGVSLAGLVENGGNAVF